MAEKRRGWNVVASPDAGGDTIDVYVFNFDFSMNPPGQPIVDPVITVGDTVRWVHAGGNHTTTAVAGINTRQSRYTARKANDPKTWKCVSQDSGGGVYLGLRVLGSGG